VSKPGLEHDSYSLSRISITPTDAPGMRRWAKKLFVTMGRNAASPIEQSGVLIERTVAIGLPAAV
jgi:KUP system potassium uptake protein